MTQTVLLMFLSFNVVPQSVADKLNDLLAGQFQLVQFLLDPSHLRVISRNCQGQAKKPPVNASSWDYPLTVTWTTDIANLL
jgi:hypothetical protein